MRFSHPSAWDSIAMCAIIIHNFPVFRREGL
jgi:hypothetical protein